MHQPLQTKITILALTVFLGVAMSQVWASPMVDQNLVAANKALDDAIASLKSYTAQASASANTKRSITDETLQAADAAQHTLLCAVQGKVADLTTDLSSTTCP